MCLWLTGQDVLRLDQISSMLSTTRVATVWTMGELQPFRQVLPALGTFWTKPHA